MVIYSFQYEDELVEAEGFEDLVAYVNLNYPPGSYQVYVTDSEGNKKEHVVVEVPQPSPVEETFY